MVPSLREYERESISLEFESGSLEIEYESCFGFFDFFKETDIGELIVGLLDCWIHSLGSPHDKWGRGVCFLYFSLFTLDRL